MGNPTNQTAEVLYELINNSPISRAEALRSTGILNLTARIANLRIRHGIDITCENVKTKNKFSRSVKYGIWSIKGKENIEKACAVYLQINSK